MWQRQVTAGLLLTVYTAMPSVVQAQSSDVIVPVTDAMLQAPSDDDWPMWRRTLDGWGYSPLDQIDRRNVGDLRLVWTRALSAGGRQQGTPLVYDGVIYMPNPSDVIQAIDAATGDLIWEYRRSLPDDVCERLIPGVCTTNRNLAIYDNLIIDTSVDEYVFALDAQTGDLVWETEILDYQVHPANQSTGPIIANGKVISGRSCMPRAGPDACVITAHDAKTGAEIWRRRTIPRPCEPGDETWGGVPDADRRHVGTWMAPSYDPDLNLLYIGTSVTSPAPKFLVGGVNNKHLYHNSTLALDADTGEIVWYYQHLNDHWDLDHPFERLLVDTARLSGHGDVDHLLAHDDLLDHRFLGLLGEGVNGIDARLDLIKRAGGVRARRQLDHDCGGVFRGGRVDLFHIRQAVHRLLDFLAGALLDLFRRRAGVRHGDVNHVRRKLGEHLLPQRPDRQETDNDDEHRHDVSGDAVLREPFDQAVHSSSSDRFVPRTSTAMPLIAPASSEVITCSPARMPFVTTTCRASA